MSEREPTGEPLAAASNVRTRQVFVDDLELMASVGVFEVEKRYEQRILVSVALDVVDDYDGVSDKLDRVLDYSGIVEACQRLAEKAHYSLVETLAERIAEATLEDRRVIRARIRIDKPDIVPGCRAVGIAITRVRRT